ncbi:hypothetical protein [Micromonospora haikouensis]
MRKPWYDQREPTGPAEETADGPRARPASRPPEPWFVGGSGKVVRR